MSEAPQLLSKSPVQTLEFRRFLEESAFIKLESLVKELGVVYVSSITRDGCSGCAEQKPLFRELAAKETEARKGRVVFTNIHIRYSESDQSESGESKKLLRHAAYPTYMIHVKSRFGPLEVYRSIYPPMDELGKEIGETLELAEYYKEDAERADP